MVSAQLQQFAVSYTEAWCSQDAVSVAACFEENGSFTVNGGLPAIGRNAIENAAQAFMTDFPDMVLYLDRLVMEKAQLRYYWTMTGTNSGPGGSGKSLRISGYEVLEMAESGLIQSAMGYYDEAEWARQIATEW